MFVDFAQGLNNAVKKVGIALGDRADSPPVVETLTSFGTLSR